MVQKKYFFIISIAYVFSGAKFLFAQDTPSQAISVSQEIPEGFEGLDGPRETAVDLFYGGLKIGSFRAIYTPTKIAFANVDEIVSKIPAVKSDSLSKIKDALTGELPTHASAICGPVPEENCGRLEPEIIALIFDESKFSAEVFINPSMLEVQDSHTEKILPPAPQIFSAVHSLNGGFFGTEGAPESFSLLTNSTMAYGAGRVNLLAAATDQEQRISTLSASLDKWGLESKIGFFDSHATSILGQFPMSGISVGTSFNTNLALRNALGNQLTIFLPQRSYVTLLYNNVIYSTDFYEAGNQVLNTDSLPDGAYEVTLRIRTLNNEITEETRFFAKNFQIPPSDQVIYYFQAGTVINNQGAFRTFPKPGDELIISGGLLKRLGAATGLNMDAHLIGDEVFAEVGAFLLLPPNHQLRTSVLAGSSEDIGLALSYLGYSSDQLISYSANLRSIQSGGESSNAADIDPISVDANQFDGNISYKLSELSSLSLQAGYARSAGKSNYAYGPSFVTDFWRDGSSNLSLRAESNVTQDGMAHSIFLRFSMRLGAFGFDSQGSVIKTPANNKPVKGSDARITWNDDETLGQHTMIGAGISHTEESDVVSADLEHRSNMGNIKLLGNRAYKDSGQSQFYSGNMGFSVAHTLNDFAWGGSKQNTSGVIVKNTGNAEDVPMKVLLNNSEVAQFDTGKPLALLIPPYQSYKISVEPAVSESIDYDGSVKDVTLYPGNIVPLTWDINRVKVVLGNVVMPDGTPVTKAELVEARNISITDDTGLFQGELLAFGTVTFRRAKEVISVVSESSAVESASLPPTSKLKATSAMSVQQQAATILDIFGPPKHQPFPTETTLPPEMSKTPPETAKEASVTTQRSNKVLPALNCQVDLPEIPPTNGVYIYSEPLVCTPIAAKETESAHEEPEQKPSEEDDDSSQAPLTPEKKDPQPQETTDKLQENIV